VTTATQPTDPHADLQGVISPPRFQAFLSAASNDPVRARELYVWNRDLSVAILADIAILEVALRNAMHDQASAAWGSHWYADPTPALDERSARQLLMAWKYLHNSIKQRPGDADVPGRVVAQCMFGFWTNLLDAGSHVGTPPRRVSVHYDTLWDNAFKFAFPGDRTEARAQRHALMAQVPNDAGKQTAILRIRRTVNFSRAWVHGICKNVNDLRNRVAHHEPLINGFPFNGQQHRMDISDRHEQIRILARMLDRGLASWIDQNSTVPTLLQQRPLLRCEANTGTPLGAADPALPSTDHTMCSRLVYRLSRLIAPGL
jgi:hypothetical protein